MPVLLQACLNGARLPAEHPALPVTPAQIAAAAAEAVAAGARELHVHPKDPGGRDSLRPEHVDPVVAALREAVPGVPVGVTTGAWAAGDPAVRLAQVAGWRSRPDHASVNWHEEGAAELAAALTGLGVGIEAGIWHAGAAAAFAASGVECLRVLVEVVDQEDPLSTARDLLARLRGVPAPLLLHGEDANAWPVFRLAAELGLDSRVGLEDTLVLPDGSPAPSNAALVRAALALAGD
ncbi:3-keto-5-aminohexanoate cleavage protein [Bailinhaonella thermotolerans]|uniref:3-keto-5-aminohexanoate cleavage protein n=1 Tax=Bailinhaonella thermotolerans TaxID=1070861 RepID=A0A3A4AVC2_9ACTN|nr:3-keto-5-aminohexanoate cleavage protein [Bailinhaonella thermotolerans]RJL34180.1 hypothetical protein D5H75_06830 [Bailinhaonella thermotolerans]